MDEQTTKTIDQEQGKKGMISLKEKKENKATREKSLLSPNIRRRNRRIKKVTKVVAVVLVIAVIGSFTWTRFAGANQATSLSTYSVVDVTRRNIETVLSSSGTVQPLNTYNITTLVKGEVIAADFLEGDTVEYGQVLYQLTTDDVQSNIESQQKSVTRAQASYDRAVSSLEKAMTSYDEALVSLKEEQENYDEILTDYEEALKQYDKLYEESSFHGVVSVLYVKEGDTLQKEGKIADIYDDSTMLLTVSFHAEDVDSSWISKEAEVFVDGSFEIIKGTVTKISEANSVLSGNQIVKNVTIQVKNPGGITTSSLATAVIDGIDCYQNGSFVYGFEDTITSEKAGEVDKIYIETGSSVSKGSMVLTFTSESIEDSLVSYDNSISSAESSLKNSKKSLESAESSISSAEDAKTEAEEALEDATEALEEAKDSLVDCAITSPVTGVVVTKDMLVGDIIGSSNMSSTLATIYDVSSVIFEMKIDELDIMSVKVGQTVNITADALENVKFTGTVVNVSLESTTSGGVTQYPITVKIDEVGNLLPGMNVTGEIILEGVESALCVPVDALKRGNVVYIKDDTVIEAVDEVPAGFKAVTVETGLSDGDYIEIKSGIAEGDQIYVSRNASETSFGMEGFGMFGGQAGMTGGMQGNFGGSAGGERPSGQNGMPSRN